MRILPAPPVISTFSQYAIGMEHRMSASSILASAVWPAARRVVYIPLYLPWAIVVRKLFWLNGGAVSGNVDCGIYSSVSGLPVTLLASTGSTAQATISVLQSVDVTDFALGPGNYFMALMIDNGTGTVQRSTGSGGIPFLKGIGMCQETPGSFPLPATATPVSITTNIIPLFGLTTVTLI